MESVFNFSIEEITGLVQKILQALKDIFAWLGVLILPDENEKKDYPGQDESTEL